MFTGLRLIAFDDSRFSRKGLGSALTGFDLKPLNSRCLSV